MSKKEIDVEYYTDLALKRSSHYNNTIKAIEIVKKFLLKNKKVLVGGQSIDYALRLKNEPGIYTDSTLPDFDIISDQHHIDAYNVAIYLYRLGFRGISVINAMHPATMRVRLNFIELLDVTYVPTKILEAIPKLGYKGHVIVHPHFQYIDQHRALSYPYETPPLETIMSRPKKDMTRYDLLYKQYPLRLLNIKNTKIYLKNMSTKLSVIENQCITGFFALSYWVNKAKNLGFKTDMDFGYFTTDLDTLSYAIPVDSNGLVLYTDDINELYNKMKPMIREEKFYNRVLDKLPRKVCINNAFELYDNNDKITAHEVKIGNVKVHIANLQHIMLYISIHYIFLMNLSNEKRGYSYFAGYLLCQRLIKWASGKYFNIDQNNETEVQSINKEFEIFLPTTEVYGARNLSEFYIVNKHKFDIKNKTIDTEESYKYAQPKHVYDRDMIYKKIPKKYLEFNYSSSDIFDLDVKEIKNFIINK
jgi:hypothetical protein